MPNEIRPCTLPAHWKQTEPFDALSVSDVFRDEKIENRKKFDFRVTLWFGSPAVSSIESPYVQTQEEQDALFQEAITTIAEALNAPVLATEEVLAGLPDDAPLLYGSATLRMNVCDGSYVKVCYKAITRHIGAFKIQAYRCSKTAEYLRQFTLDGVRIKEGG